MSLENPKVFKAVGHEKIRCMASTKSRTLNYAKGQQIRANVKSEEPAQYFKSILVDRGYNIDAMWIDGLHSRFCIQPSQKQKDDYDIHAIDAIRKNDLATLSTLLSLGRSMDACNSHSESLLHLACRKSSVAVITFMTEHCETAVVDDFGRTPLHDVCWRCIPNFDIARVVLDFDASMMLVKDKYGACPLQYVPPSQWSRWCEFLDRVKDTYWPPCCPENDHRDYADDLLVPSSSLGDESGDSRRPSTLLLEEMHCVSSVVEL